MDIKIIQWEGLDWVDVTHHKDKWRAVVITITKVGAPRRSRISWLKEEELPTEDEPTAASSLFNLYVIQLHCQQFRIQQRQNVGWKGIMNWYEWVRKW